MGIAGDDLARLFQPITQVDVSSTRRFSGTGLGLSIAKRMAELLGGQAEVASRVGEGADACLDKPIDFKALIGVLDIAHAPGSNAGGRLAGQAGVRAPSIAGP